MKERGVGVEARATTESEDLLDLIILTNTIKGLSHDPMHRFHKTPLRLAGPSILKDTLPRSKIFLKWTKEAVVDALNQEREIEISLLYHREIERKILGQLRTESQTVR